MATDNKPNDDNKPDDDKPAGGKPNDDNKPAGGEQTRQLPDDLDGTDDDAGTEQLGDAGKRALLRLRQERKDALAARAAEQKRADELAAKVKEFEDKDKSELERATGDRDSWKTRAEKAEAANTRRDLAEALAPDHATTKQIAQVARRMQGSDEDSLRKDAEELFELIAPAPSSNGHQSSSGKPPGGKPTERLRGGSDPDGNDPGEMDPIKLAALIPRRP